MKIASIWTRSLLVLALLVTAACNPKESSPDECLPYPTGSLNIAKGCYYVTSPIIVEDNNLLTLSSGVTLIFSPTTYLEVVDGAALKAVGTSDEPILLTSRDKLPGSWGGVIFMNAASSDNQFDYVTVEYGGGAGTEPEAPANINLASTGEPVSLSISNSTLRYSSSHALVLAPSASMPSFNGNTLTSNREAPVLTDSETVGLLKSSSRYSGNNQDWIEVINSRVLGDVTWETLDVPYVLSSDLTLQHVLTLQAGATLIFREDAGIRVTDENNSDEGGLNAIGTSTAPITFTGFVKEEGTWGGILFMNTANAANAFEYVTVEYGGANTHSPEVPANINLASTGEPVLLSITNSTLRHGSSHALVLAQSARMPAFVGNTLTNNSATPVLTDFAAVELLGNSSSYTGNAQDLIEVQNRWLLNDATWDALDVPFVISGSVSLQHVLTLQPGTTLLFREDAGISVTDESGPDYEGGLNAIGTSTNPIVFTGFVKERGTWGGILFINNNNSANVLDYVTVEYGGANTHSPEAPANVTISATTIDPNSSTVTITNSTIRASSTWGVWIETAGAMLGATSTNTYADNAVGDVHQE